jgi:hypothetical protein
MVRPSLGPKASPVGIHSTQEVSMQGSCSFQGLLIAENAG